MKKNKWYSIIEVIVVVTIITLWLTWVYKVLNGWQKLALTTENKIKAINIAREWIEQVQNIRDSNWLKFSSDYVNCWNVKDYNSECVWSWSVIRIATWSYTIIQSWSLFYLSGIISPAASFSWEIKQFPVFFDSNWLITQSWSITSSWCTSYKWTSCRSIFSRKINIEYTDADKMKVNSIVRWIDSASSEPHEINLPTILTNWKRRF